MPTIRPPSPRELPACHWPVILAAVLGSLTVFVLLLAICSVVAPNNARCRACQYEFRLPEEYRPKRISLRRSVTCPRCTDTQRAFFFYKPRKTGE